MARILIVKDNSDVAIALTALLQWSGHEAHAVDGGPALHAAERISADVVISDIDLPPHDVHAMASTLRGRYGEQMQLVALTAHDDGGTRREIENAGFNTILIKPASLHEILKAIQ